MKAIETVYNGYRFRSRLEARWAVFFDSAGIRYQYEAEGFEVEGCDGPIRYLPDFYLPDFGVYCEVKPSREKLMEDSEKLAWMIDFNGPMSGGLLILGQIPNAKVGDFPCFVKYSCDKGIWSELVTITWNGITSSSFDLLGGHGCTTAPDFEFPDRYHLEGHYFGRSGDWDDLFIVRKDFPTLHKDGTVWTLHKTEVPVSAYAKARQARFEFGE